MDRNSFIPREKMFEIVDDLAEIGVKAVTFSGGGEPLMYPHLLLTLRKMYVNGIKTAVLTNGSLLRGEIARDISCRSVWTRISIDGWDNKSYSEYRGVSEGEFDKVLQNIRDFKALGGKCELGVSIIVDKKNATHIRELATKLIDCGVSNIKISPCIVSDEVDEINEYHKPLFDIVGEQIKGLPNIYDGYRKQIGSFKKNYNWCPFLQILTVIGADLNIYTCQDKAYSFNEGMLGTIQDKRFIDFWFEDKTKFFGITPSIHCNHHCVADSKNKLILDYLDLDKEHIAFV